MLSAVPRARFEVLGTKGSYLKKKFDPLENELRVRAPGPGESWMLEKPENFGEVTLVDGDRVGSERSNRSEIGASFMQMCATACWARRSCW